MNRQDYLRMRNSRNLDFGHIYNFCKSKKDDFMSLEVFRQTFQVYFQMNQKHIIDFFDREFKINIVLDKKGNELMYL